MLPEQVRQPVRGHAPALVRYRDRDVHAVDERDDADGRRRGSLARCVGEQVVEDLDDALPVGQHARQVLRQVEVDGVPAAPAEERLPGLLHQRDDLHRLGDDRQGAGLDAARVEQVGDEAAHVVGLLVDDVRELLHLDRVEAGGGAQQGGGRALDGGQRGPQLVAHEAQELGPLALEVLERREVLHGDDHGVDLAAGRPDGRGVEEGGDASAAGDREHDLLGAHPLGALELLRERELGQRDLAAVAAAARHDLQQVLRGLPRLAQAVGDAPRLRVQRHRGAALRVEDGDPHGAGLDEGLEVGAGPLLALVGARVGDRRRRLGGEQHQDLLVLAGELLVTLLVAEEEVADVQAPVAHRGPLEGGRRDAVGGEAEGTDVGANVPQPNRRRQVAEVLEEPRPVGPLGEPAVLLGRQAGRDHVAGLPAVVDGRDQPVAGTGQGAGGIDDLLQDGVEVEAGADAQHGRAQPGVPVAQRLVLASQPLEARHGAPRRLGAEAAAGPRAGPAADRSEYAPRRFPRRIATLLRPILHCIDGRHARSRAMST